ncbi:hypothetical protein ARMSODRAFT_1020497 [Armillaria solidipes]|uniref:Uncharacterized protein n=1 Tax=Armillaria solidipes TaxID=1076256 RepID=A0A2H3BSB9_9AGAR|nr:hypothetical protein ARMSODRAFT_1020497 [Armillaria solidipes]
MHCISLFVLVLSSLTVFVSSAPIAIPVPETEVDARNPEANPDPAGCLTMRFSCY